VISSELRIHFFILHHFRIVPIAQDILCEGCFWTLKVEKHTVKVSKYIHSIFCRSQVNKHLNCEDTKILKCNLFLFYRSLLQFHRRIVGLSGSHCIGIVLIHSLQVFPWFLSSKLGGFSCSCLCFSYFRDILHCFSRPKSDIDSLNIYDCYLLHAACSVSYVGHIKPVAKAFF
jgi:hypothetical protein